MTSSVGYSDTAREKVLDRIKDTEKEGTDSVADGDNTLVAGIMSGVDDGTVAVTTSVSSDLDNKRLFAEVAPIMDEEMGTDGVKNTDMLSSYGKTTTNSDLEDEGAPIASRVGGNRMCRTSFTKREEHDGEIPKTIALGSKGGYLGVETYCGRVNVDTSSGRTSNHASFTREVRTTSADGGSKDNVTLINVEVTAKIKNFEESKKVARETSEATKNDHLLADGGTATDAKEIVLKEKVVNVDLIEKVAVTSLVSLRGSTLTSCDTEGSLEILSNSGTPKIEESETLVEPRTRSSASSKKEESKSCSVSTTRVTGGKATLPGDHFVREHKKELCSRSATIEAHEKTHKNEFATIVTYGGAERGPPLDKTDGSDRALTGLNSKDTYIHCESTSTLLAKRIREPPSEAPNESVKGQQ